MRNQIVQKTSEYHIIRRGITKRCNVNFCGSGGSYTLGKNNSEYLKFLRVRFEKKLYIIPTEWT